MKDHPNISRLANRLINQRMLITPAAHSNLIKQIEVLLESPYIPTIGNDEVFETEANATVEPGSTYVIGINGILAKDVSPIEECMLGLVDVEWISDKLSEAASDGNVANIVLNINSPGGETCGIEELGRKIKNIDENIKPVYAWTDKLACSAAYWLASQARMIGMIPSAEVAGIGVYSLVLDCTEQMKQQGLSIFIASSGAFKMMGHEFRSLTPEEKKILQDSCEEQHEKFKSVILEKRPQVKAESMEGLSYEGKSSLSNGLCDVLFDEMDEFMIFINSSAVTERQSNMKSATTVKVQTSATTKAEEAKPGESYSEKKEEKELPGVPGATGAESAEHPEPDEDDAGGESDHDEDNEGDMEECTCEACGSKYQKKKQKKAEEAEEAKAEVAEEAKCTEDEEEEDEKDTPKKMETPSNEDWQAVFGIKKQAVSKEKLEWDTAMKNSFTGNPFEITQQ